MSSIHSRPPTPLLQPPPRLDEQIAACRAASLLTLSGDGEAVRFFVHRWTATELARRDALGPSQSLAKAHRQIEPVRHHISHIVAHDEFEREIRIAVEEAGQPPGQGISGEERIDIHPQPAAHDIRRSRSDNRRRFDAFEMRVDTFIELTALIGQRQ